MRLTQESIFVGAIRSFCTSFAAILGILIGILLIVFTLLIFSRPDIMPDPAKLTIAEDADGNRQILPESTPAVLRLDITGVIGVGDLTFDNVNSILLDSREDLLKNNRVKAILLYLNTPGGTVTDGDGIYRALLNYKKKYNVPIYAYVDGLCASGGMYISAAADRIYATEQSVVGSIGVILGPTFNFSQAMDKFGIQSLTITEGIDKDMLSPFRPWKPGEDKCLRDIIAETYKNFVDIIVGSRPRVNKDKLVNEYGAQVYTATQGQAMGYVDVAGSDYSQALKDLVKAAGIPDNEAYQVVKLAMPTNLFSELTQGTSALFSGKIKHSFEMGPYYNPELSGKLLYLYQPSQQIR